jgi:hypothetical protein
VHIPPLEEVIFHALPKNALLLEENTRTRKQHLAQRRLMF